MKHTKEPWSVGDINKTLVVSKGKRIAACGIETPNQILQEQEENARRIVAAVNACEGFTTEELEINVDGVAGAGFWGRTSARLVQKNRKLKEENARLRQQVLELGSQP